MTQPNFRNETLLNALVLALAAVSSGCKETEAKATTMPVDAVVSVALAKVATGNVPKYLVLTGSLRGSREAKIAADASGRVVATFVERGDYVAAGRPIVRLDARGAALARTEAAAMVESARVEESHARSDCDRAERLFSDRAISAAEHERLMTACSARSWSTAVASTREQLANKSLGDTVIRAPFSGVVGERLVNIGEYVHPGVSAATIVELDPLRLELSVPESAVGVVREDQAVDFEVAAFPGERFEGTIRRIGASLELPSRSLVVEATVPNSNQKLRPGMFATARVAVGANPAPIVPKDALVGSERSRRAFVVHDKRLEERVVLVGEMVGTNIAVLSGLRTDDWIAAHPTSETRDGTRVE